MQPDICLTPPQWIETSSTSDICNYYQGIDKPLRFKKYNNISNSNIEYIIKFLNNDVVVEYNNTESTSITKTEVTNNLMENGKIISKKYSNIMFKNKNISLNKPIEFLIEQEDDAILISNSFLNIYAYGNNLEDAEQEMYSQFQMVWEMFTSKDSNLLDESGVKIIEYLLSFGDLNK